MASMLPRTAIQSAITNFLSVVPTTVPPDKVISGFPEYAANLTGDQHKLLDELAEKIVASHRGFTPIVAVVIVGHSDKDLRPDNPERKKGETPGQFEMRISGARAARAKEALLAKIRVISRGRSTHQLEQLLTDPKRSRTVGMGATDRLRQNPVNDTERKLNRRVEFHLVTALIPDPDPPCSLDGARQEIPEEDFHRINLAYAITVHKAQGSQFKRVIVPVVKSCLLDRTLIYTALTRGMEQVVFIGDRDAFDAAVTAPPHSHERQVGFSM